MTQAETAFTGAQGSAPTGFLNDLSRREVFGGCMLAAMAAAAAPVIAAPLTGREQWNAAMERYRAAKARADNYDETVYKRAERLGDLDGKGVPWHIGREDDRLRDLESAADKALMTMPAPDLAALRWKLDRALMIDDGALANWSEWYVRQTIADVARLLGPAG